MKREIKFRSWNKTQNKMLYKAFHDNNWYLTPFNDKNGCNTYSIASSSDRHILEVMQFTGLKDVNGKEIYENDVVELFSDEIGSYIPAEFKGVVAFMEGGFMVDNKKDNAFPVWQEIATWKIIGNIYENPELLDEQTT